MQRLSERLALECHAGVQVADQIMVVARTGAHQPFGLGVEVGQRLPLVPPLGTPYVAWSGPQAIEAYRFFYPTVSGSAIFKADAKL